MLFISDLDGTLFDNRARQHLIPADPTQAHNWHDFHAAARELDVPIMHNINVVRAFAAAGNPIVYLTSRTIATGPISSAQLRDHHLPVGDLMMRPNDEHRRPVPYKMDAIAKILRWHDSEMFILMDDDKGVCQAVRDTYARAVVIEVPSNDIAL